MNEQEKQIASDLAGAWMKQGYYTGETKGLVQIGLFHALVAHRRAIIEECQTVLQARNNQALLKRIAELEKEPQ